MQNNIIMLVMLGNVRVCFSLTESPSIGSTAERGTDTADGPRSPVHFN